MPPKPKFTKEQIISAALDIVRDGSIEVITAQESLLNAQLSEASNMYNGAQAIIALYIALGGGTM